jgi:hypothetical protein
MGVAKLELAARTISGSAGLERMMKYGVVKTETSGGQHTFDQTPAQMLASTQSPTGAPAPNGADDPFGLLKGVNFDGFDFDIMSRMSHMARMARLSVHAMFAGEPGGDGGPLDIGAAGGAGGAGGGGGGGGGAPHPGRPPPGGGPTGGRL